MLNSHNHRYQNHFISTITSVSIVPSCHYGHVSPCGGEGNFEGIHDLFVAEATLDQITSKQPSGRTLHLLKIRCAMLAQRTNYISRQGVAFVNVAAYFARKARWRLLRQRRLRLDMV